MAEANDYFVDMHELNAAAGRRIAEVMKAEAALVTAGSFSAMILGAAACLTGDRTRARIDALPHPTWAKRECLTQKAHRFDYDRAYRAAGMTMVDVETKEQLINAHLRADRHAGGAGERGAECEARRPAACRSS